MNTEYIKNEILESFESLLDLMAEKTKCISSADMPVKFDVDYYNIKKLLQRGLNCEEILIPYFQPIALGNTENNIRQFEFLQALIDENEMIFSIKRLGGGIWGSKINARGDGLCFDDIFISGFAKKVADKLRLMSVEGVHKENIAKALANFLFYYVNFSRIDCKKIPFVIIANDHVPTVVGFEQAAKMKGIDRLYLQHAGVTKDFPRLDYDISILGNEKSIDLYRTVADYVGDNKVLILPRSPFISKKVYLNEGHEANGKIDVCLYLTGDSIELNLRTVLTNLKNNKYIDNVYIKPHPNNNYNACISNFLNENKNALIDKSLDYYHIAICGNSSVCISLVAAGIPTYQCFALDSYGVDYYRFVSDGLCQEIGIGKLGEKFWLKHEFNFESIDKYVPSFDSDIVKNSAFVLLNYIEDSLLRFDFLSRDFDRKGGYFFSYLKLIKSELRFVLKQEDSHVHMEWLSSRGFKSIFDVSNRIDLIQYLHRCRTPNIYELVKAAIENEDDINIRIYFKYFYAYWVNNSLPVGEVVNDIKKIENKPTEKIAAAQLFDYSLFFLPCDIFYRFFDYSFLENHSIKSSRNICRLITAYVKGGYFGDDRSISYFRESLCLSEKEHYLRSMLLWAVNDVNSHSDELDKILGVKVAFDSHDSEISKLSRNIDKAAGCQLVDIYSKINSLLGSNRVVNFLMARVFVELRYDFLEIVKTKLTEKQPFAFVRLSEGEGYLFEGYEFSRYDAINRELHWWGGGLADSLRKEIISDFNDSLYLADAIGIPSIFRFWRDLPLQSKKLDLSLQLRGMLSVLHGFSDFLTACSFSKLGYVLEEKSNVFLFNKNAVLDLARSAKKIVFVSSVSVSSLRLFLDGYDVQYISIPTHHRTSLTNGYISSDKRLPYIYKDIINLITQASGPGVLVLVSAGVIGKLFVLYAKKYGAVALDIGECADRYHLGVC